MPIMDELALAGGGSIKVIGKGTIDDYMKLAKANFSKGSGLADDFTGKLRGKEHTLKNVKDEKYLRELGFSEKDIAKIKNGNVPQGWQVHHKLPLDDSGTNDFANLVLIENDPWHKVITNHQNSVARGMKSGDIKQVDWPMIDGNIYPK